MSEIDLPGTSPFRELRGDYVEHAGQQIDPREYLDFFEPLGSALSRYPDGAGGPFVYRFTASGGRVIGALGWVVSAASRRYGAWKLWGIWTERPIPAVALPLFWPQLADPSRAARIADRANRDAPRLFNRGQWSGLRGEIGRMRIQDANFREILKAELSHAYAVRPPYRQPIEIELAPGMLDLLPWIYILGPVDPTEAQLQPSRFNGGGYQYILADGDVALRDAEIPDFVEEIVDAATDDVISGLKKANEHRARLARPARAPALPRPPVPREPPRPKEDETMPARKASAVKPVLPLERWIPFVTPLYRIAVLALLAWIAMELRDIRNAMPGPPTAVIPMTTTTAATVAPLPTTTAPAADGERESPEARVRRIAQLLAAAPPQGIRVNRTAIVDTRSLANAAVEVFLRRNGCLSRAEAVDGKISAAEQRAMRDCTALRTERLVNSRGEIDQAHAIAWLERVL